LPLPRPELFTLCVNHRLCLSSSLVITESQPVKSRNSYGNRFGQLWTCWHILSMVHVILYLLLVPAHRDSTYNEEVYMLCVHESVHRDTTMKITNKMYYIVLLIIPSRLYKFRVIFRPSSGALDCIYSISCCRLKYVDCEACIHTSLST
jgi:predicted Kef-type K+ transport protein